MTIEQVLAQVDEIKPNTYDDNTKILWLSELDGRIWQEIIKTHEGAEEYLKALNPSDYEEVTEETEEDTEPVEEEQKEPIEFVGYDTVDLGKVLLAPFPYDKLYREYIFAQIDYSNGETDRYINSATAFNAAYTDFAAFYNRTHLPISNPLKLF